MATKNKKRPRQTQRQPAGNEGLSMFPSLFLFLLLGGSHLPKYHAFQFLPMQNNYCSNIPTISKSIRKSSITKNGLLWTSLRRRNRQEQSYNVDSQISLYSQSIDGINECSSSSNNNRNGTEAIEQEKLDRKQPPPIIVSEQKEAPSVNVPSNIAEAKALRAQAEELRAEARAMELELRQRAAKQQQAKDAITDEMITALFLPLQYQDPQLTSGIAETGTEPTPSVATDSAAASMIPDARVVADRLRQGKFSRQQIISVVDRLYEQNHNEKGNFASTNTTFGEKEEMDEKQKQQLQEGEGGTNGGETTTRNNPNQYSDCSQVLVQAAVLLDESIVANTRVDDTAKSTPATIPTARISQRSTSSASSESSSASLSSLSTLSALNFSSSSSPSSSLSSPIPFVTSGQIGKAIQSRIVELRELRQLEMSRKMAVEAVRMSKMTSSSGWSSEYSGSATNRTSSTSATGDLSQEIPSFIPMWIPSPYIPYILSLDKTSRSWSSLSSGSASNTTTAGPVVPFVVVRNSTLEAKELEVLKNEVLLGSRFYTTSFEFAPGAVLFRGNIRTSRGRVPTMVPSLETSSNGTAFFKPIDNNTAMVFADIQERLEACGLGDKVQLFVLPDPEAAMQTDENKSNKVTQERRPHIESAAIPEEKPVILALPKKLTPDESKLKKSWIKKFGKRLSYPLAALSTFFYSIKAFALNPNFFEALIYHRDATVLYSCIPLALGFLSVQLIHEVAHYLVAKRKKIKIGFPVPMSALFFSNLPFFGCITPLRSFPPNRAALVDFALSGPMASLAVSLCMVFGGLMLTGSASAVQIARYPFLSVHTIQSNFLLGSILSWMLPKTMMLPLAQPIPMHPLVVVGRFGMISSALNLLPIFRLDGGRACFAALGQRQGAVISAFTILWIVSTFFMSSPMILVWTIMVALFQMRVEIPCRDECTEVGGKREWLWFLSFVLSMSILSPFPGFPRL